MRSRSADPPGHGVPVGRELVEAGCTVHGIDVSPSLVAAFRRNLPSARAEVTDTTRFSADPGTFDAMVAWGLLFLLDPPDQEAVIRNAAPLLRPGGRVLATDPWQDGDRTDSLTGRRCVSLGRAMSRGVYAEVGLVVLHEEEGEAGNGYGHVMKPPAGSATT